MKNSMFRLKSLLLLFIPLVVYGATVIPNGLITDKLDVDNVRVDGNTVSTTNTNGDLTFDLNGTGSLIFSDLTATTVPYLDASKKLTSSAATPTQLGYLANATSNLCGINQACTETNKTFTSPVINGATFTGNVGLGVSASRALVTDGSGNVAASAVTSTELGYVSGVTSTLCGISQSCTLSNKTLSGANFTGSVGLGASYASKIIVADTFGNLAASTASAAEAARLVGVLSSLCGITDTCTQTNKTFTGPVIDAVVYDDQGSTPSSPSSGYYKLYVKTDGKAYLLNSSGTETAIGSGSGGSGGVNYIANGDAVTDTTGWSTYDDSSATLVDGTGGTFNSAFTRTTSASEQVRQNSISSGAFKFAKDAANRQGEGVCYAFSIDRIDFPGKTQKISFDYYTTSNYASDDMYVAVYGYADAPQVISARNSDGGYIKAAANGTTPGRFEAYFEPDNLNLSYRACLHVRTTNATAYDLVYDNFQVGPQQTYATVNQSEWVAYTPVFTGAGTVTGVNFRSRRNGPNLEVEGYFITGTVTATTATLTLGFNGTSGNVTTLSTITANQNFGTWNSNNFGQAAASPVLAGPSATTVGFGIANAAIGNAMTMQNGSAIWGNTNALSVKFSVPIQGWNAGTVLAADAFNSQFPVPLYATSSTKTQTASGNWASMTGNSLTLTQGVWELSGSCQFGNSGSAPPYQYVGCNWHSANGGDSGSTPTALSSGSGITLLNAVAGTFINMQSAGSNEYNLQAPVQQLRCANSTCTVYLNMLSAHTTSANTRLTAYPTAKKIPDYTVYGNVNKAPTKQIFTASGTYTKPAGVRYIDYIVIGGGGDGGGSVVNGSGTGGGAGGMSQGTISNVPDTLTITVGSRGAPGGASSIAGTGITTITANGGTNGVCCNTSGGAGGTASGGEINTTGQYGGNAYYLTSDFDPGDGGSTIFPGGGRGAGTAIGTSGTQAATGYGNGGGGSANGAGGGGAGTSGIVIIKEYY